MAKYKPGDILQFTEPVRYDLPINALMFIYEIETTKGSTNYYLYERIVINPIGPTELYSCATSWLDGLPSKYVKRLDQTAKILYYSPYVGRPGSLYKRKL